MDDDLESLAYDLRMSKAGTIRRILARAVAETHNGGVRNSKIEELPTVEIS
jgi:hypothetical protein